MNDIDWPLAISLRCRHDNGETTWTHRWPGLRFLNGRGARQKHSEPDIEKQGTTTSPRRETLAELRKSVLDNDVLIADHVVTALAGGK